MADEKADAGAATETKPDFLLPKFKSVEEQARGYAELEKQFTKSRQAGDKAGEPAAGIELPKSPAVDDDAGIESIVEAAGLDPEEVGRTFAEKGDLSETQYAALKKAYPGLTKGAIRQTLDAINRNVASEQAAIRTSAVQRLGGEQQLENLLTWAKDNLTKEEIADWREDTATRSGAEKSLTWLIDKHRIAIGAGKAQPLIEGEMAGGAVGAFASQREMLTMKRDKRMKSDPAFEKLYHQKLAATPMDVISKSL